MTYNIPINHTTSTHCCTVEDDNDNRRHSCCSHCNSNKDQPSLNPLELKTFSLTPPLDNIYFETDSDQPFTCIYLTNLFLAPDMARYLQETTISDNVYDIPLHLQKLICEAKLEVQMNNKDDKHYALKKLEKVRSYVQAMAHGDTSALISALNELIQNEDELNSIVCE